MTTFANPAAPSPSGWMGHPRPLARLFSIEMWERFGYYGMRALLTLYLTKHFLLGDRASTGLYGGYTALVYLTPLVGGLVADQYLGSKRAVKFGALMMAIGYFALAFGGAPAQSMLNFDGQDHPITVAQFHDGPTTGAQEKRRVTVAGQDLRLIGNSDGGMSLLGANGHLARSLPRGSYRAHSVADPLHLTILLLAMATIAVGNGFFKPNISTMVGTLYAPGDSRRDAGFTIFYMGINLGSILGQFFCALFADWLGWWAGFAIAGVGMVASWLLLHFDGGLLAAYGESPQTGGKDRAPRIYAGALLAIPLVYWLFSNLMAAHAPAAGTGFMGYITTLPVMGKLLFGTFLVAVPGILYWSWRNGSPQELRQMAAAMVLVAFNTVFFSLFEQAGSSLTLFADRNTDRSVFGLFDISAPQTQNFNPLAIIVLAPMMGALWGWLGRRNLEPSIPVKFAVGLIGVGAGFLFLVFGAGFAGPNAQVGLWWLAGLYVIHSIAELCISPVGLSMITRLSIARIMGLMMGVWFLSIAMAQYVAGAVAQVATVKTVGGEVANPQLSLATYLGVFTQIGWVAVGLGVVLLALARPLRRLMRGVV